MLNLKKKGYNFLFERQSNDCCIKHNFMLLLKLFKSLFKFVVLLLCKREDRICRAITFLKVSCVYSNDCSRGNEKKRVLGHRCLFLLNLRRNCPAAGLLAVKSYEKCHESEATTIRFSAEKRQGVRDASVPGP